MARTLNRRELMKVGLGGAGLLGAGSGSLSGDVTSTGQEQVAPGGRFRETARDVPIVDDADVVICGAGPAGVAAGLAAARLGASVRLIESAGCLGGVWTAGLLCWILDTKDKPGILHEIMSALKARQAGYVNQPGYSFGYDAEVMKLLLEEMCAEAGVRFQLHTQAVAAARGADRRLTLAVTESKSGRQAWAGKAFVDATGDGDLAARTGCKFDLGRPEDGATQPMTMMAILTGVEHETIKRFVRDRDRPHNVPKDLLRAEINRGGFDPSYNKPTLFRIYENLFCLSANHEYGYVPTDAAKITEATAHARAELHQIINALRCLGGIWKDLRIVATNEHIGVREGRRIQGHYTVTADDLARGARHDDGICRVYFSVDVHSPTTTEGKGIARTGVRARPYDIPLRALIARDVNGLLLAGRCISGDFIAHSSYRVTGDAVATGQAAGVTAALAAQHDCLPHEVPWARVKAALAEFDAHLS
jgi:hypothetical protein